MNKWIPKTFDELIKERITFCQTFVNSHKIITKENSETVSNFTKYLTDLEYCRKLFTLYKKNNNDEILEKKFKSLASKIISDIFTGFDSLTNESFSYKGVLLIYHNIEDKDGYLPQETKDYIAELKPALEKIFNEVNEM